MKKKIFIGVLIIFAFCIMINSKKKKKKSDTEYYEITILDKYKENNIATFEGDILSKQYERITDDGYGKNFLTISIAENSGISSLSDYYLDAFDNYFKDRYDTYNDVRVNVIKKLEKKNGVDCIHLLYIDGPKGSEFTSDLDIYIFASDKYVYQLTFEGYITEDRDISKCNPEMTKMANSFKIKDTVKDSNNGIPFTDVPSSAWYGNAVKYIYDNNIIKGLNDYTFSPKSNLTRGMMVTILYRMEGSPKVTGVSNFTDVKDSGKYYYKAVKWASDKKIVSGYNNGNFGPTDNITREQLAVILYKYAKYKKKDVSKTNDLSAFSDAGKVASYALKQVKWAVASGVITGSNGKLNPKGNATRAEVAAMMEKYCKRVGK